MDHDGSSSAIHMGKTSVLFWPISTCLVTPSWVHPDTGHPVPLGIPHCYCRPVCGQGFTDGGLWRNRLVHQAPWRSCEAGKLLLPVMIKVQKKNCWSLIYENLCIHGFHIRVIRVLYSQAMRDITLPFQQHPFYMRILIAADSRVEVVAVADADIADIKSNHVVTTVDGRNPSPVGTWFIPL